MPTQVRYLRSRRAARRVPALPAPAESRAQVVGASPLRVPSLVGIPSSVTIHHGLAEAERRVSEAPLRRLGRYLRPADAAADERGLIEIAIRRALPEPPTFRQFTVGLSYGYESRSCACHADPEEASDFHDSYKRPVVFVDTTDHVWIELGPILPHLFTADEDAARWLALLLNDQPGTLTIEPCTWMSYIEHSYWCGMNDESESIEQAGGKEEYEGPKRFDIEQAIPAWVRASPKPRDFACHVTNLRMIGRLERLGIKTRHFFEADGERVRITPLRITISEPYQVAAFGWRRGDWVEQAIDDLKQMTQQCGSESAVCACFPCHSLPRAATTLTRFYSQLTALDELCTSLNQYRSKHRLA